MKIAAWSDGHGTLPKLKDDYADVMIIAGDFTPLAIQRQTNQCLEWFANEFLNYVRKANCKKVLLVPGNHDFLCERISPKVIKEIIDNDPDVKDKLVYLIDEAYEYKGLKFYGCPWCTGPAGWAFCPNDEDSNPADKYQYIPEDTDILITHQPPKVDKVGCSFPYTHCERNFGSDRLRDVLDERKIKLHFCGHIHTGTHDGVPYGNTMIYNVSIKNEQYKDVYEITFVEI